MAADNLDTFKPPKPKPDWLLITTQTLAYLISAIPLRLFFRVQRTFRSDLKNLTRGTLVIANHQSHFDPFMVLACIPFKDFLRLLPIHFPTTEVIFKNRVYNPRFFPFISLLGCFSIGNSAADRMRSIFYIRTLLSRRQTVFIFPEGGISKELNIQNFKRGVDFFVPHSHSVLFVRIQGLTKPSPGGKRGSCRVTFGEVFSPPPHMSAEEIRDYLNKLAT